MILIKRKYSEIWISRHFKKVKLRFFAFNCKKVDVNPYFIEDSTECVQKNEENFSLVELKGKNLFL